MTFSFMVIVGTRPEIIKMSPVIREINSDRELDLIFVHSGQHYDYGLSKHFFEDLELPNPDLNLDIGSGTHAEQTSQMLVKFEQVICEYNPDVVLVEGDTNTVLAAGLASVKLQVPFGHVEAGIRSYDRKMPEEINRRIAAVCAELHFAPTERAAVNLLNEGVLPDKIFVTGNTIVDACLQNVEIAKRKSRVLDRFGFTKGQHFAMITAHRPENVDEESNLRKLVEILLSIKGCKLLFSVHPRTMKTLKRYNLVGQLEANDNLILSEPLGYLDFLRLLSASKFVLTDSGGIQEEAVTLGIPCITLRKNTERPETIEIGVNKLVGLDKELALKSIGGLLNKSNYQEFPRENPYGDGKAAKKIVQIVKSVCSSGLDVPTASFLQTGTACYSLLEIDTGMAGKTIREIAKEQGKSIVLIYDSLGNPHFPNPEVAAEAGWKLVTFGEHIDRY